MAYRMVTRDRLRHVTPKGQSLDPKDPNIYRKQLEMLFSNNR